MLRGQYLRCFCSSHDSTINEWTMRLTWHIFITYVHFDVTFVNVYPAELYNSRTTSFIIAIIITYSLYKCTFSCSFDDNVMAIGRSIIFYLIRSVDYKAKHDSKEKKSLKPCNTFCVIVFNFIHGPL